MTRSRAVRSIPLAFSPTALAPTALAPDLLAQHPGEVTGRRRRNLPGCERLAGLNPAVTDIQLVAVFEGVTVGGLDLFR